MIKNIIKYFCILLVVSTYQYKLYAMEATQEWIGNNLANVFPLQPEYVDDLPTSPEASTGIIKDVKDIAQHLATLSINTPDAVRSAIDAKNIFASKPNETPPPFSYEQLEAQKVADHNRSQKHLQTINILLRNAGGTINSFTHALVAATYLAHHATTLTRTFQPNPDDKGKEEEICPRKAQIAREKQRIADRQHFEFLGAKAIGVIESSNAALQQITSLAIQTNRNLETIERIYTLINQSNNNRFQPRTLEDEQILHQQRMAEGQQFQTTLTWSSYYAASFMRSLESLFTSDSYRHNITHTKNNAVQTFGSITSIAVGALLVRHHLTNHIDQKSTILASIGAGMIAVPWMTSFMHR